MKLEKYQLRTKIKQLQAKMLANLKFASIFSKLLSLLYILQKLKLSRHHRIIKHKEGMFCNYDPANEKATQHLMWKRSYNLPVPRFQLKHKQMAKNCSEKTSPNKNAPVRFINKVA